MIFIKKKGVPRAPFLNALPVNLVIAIGIKNDQVGLGCIYECVCVVETQPRQVPVVGVINRPLCGTGKQQF